MSIDDSDRINETQIIKAKATAEVMLIDHPENRRQFELDRQWPKQFPTAPGVYTIFIASELIYVGETSSLQARMKDIQDTRTHTFRRTHGRRLFKDRPGFEPATASRRFTEELEKELSEHMGSHVSVCVMECRFGRKEIEEYLTEKFSPAYCRTRLRGG